MRKIKLEFRYLDIGYELWALRFMLDAIEPTIRHVSEQDERQVLAELKRKGWDADEVEVDLARQEIRDKQEFVLPRFLRGPFVISLAAVFESGAQAVAERLAHQTRAGSSLARSGGGAFLSRARKYFDDVLGMPLETDAARSQRLSDLYLVRNALAHANGLKAGMTNEKWRRLNEVLAHRGAEQTTFHGGAIVLTQSFVEAAFEDVDGSLQSLLGRARVFEDKLPKRAGTTTRG